MKHDAIPSFLATATKEVMNELGAHAVDIAAGETDARTGYELIVASGITGDLKGILMIKFELRDAVGIANLMLTSIGQAAVTDTMTNEHKEALSEIGNVLSGRFVNIISQNGIDSNLTPPSIITGSGITSSTKSLLNAAELRVQSGPWSFMLSLGLSPR